MIRSTLHAGEIELFTPCDTHPQIALIKKDVQRSRNVQVKALFESGFGMHHAGMLRSDRNLTERLFSAGHIKVLCCTATLAWGVNLPAHTVIIKGTQVCSPVFSAHDLGHPPPIISQSVQDGPVCHGYSSSA
jgi:activating signal cointegrator complex subunit 3